MANAPQPNVPPGTETPGLTKSWGTKSLSGLGWLSRLSPWSNDPTPVSSKKRIAGRRYINIFGRVVFDCCAIVWPAAFNGIGGRTCGSVADEKNAY